MDRGAALKRLSSLLMRGGHSRLNSVAAQPSTTGLQYARGIAASAAAAAKGAQATPPQQVPAQPAGGRAGGGGGGGGGGRSMGPVLLLPAGVAAGLGAWQLARRSDKVQQLDDRLAAMRAEPVDIFATTEQLPEFSPVAAEGEFDEANTIFVGPRPRSAMGGTIAGNMVVMPLRDASRGAAALVVRGWAPADWQPDRAAPVEWVRIEGVTRTSEARGGFVPDNVPGAGPADPGAHWYWLEGPALARAAGLPPDTPLMEAVVDEHARDVAPSAMEVLGGRTTSLGNARVTYPEPRAREELLRFPVMPQGHLNYAATWFTLSGCIAAAALMAMRRRRLPTAPRPGGGAA